MARKVVSDSSDDELPELDEFINKHVQDLHALSAPKLNPPNLTSAASSPSRPSPKKAIGVLSPQKQLRALEFNARSLDLTPRKARQERVARTEPGPPRSTRRPLSPRKNEFDSVSVRSSNAERVRATPHRKAKDVASYRNAVDLTAETDDEQSEMGNSIFCDSDSDVKPTPREERDDILPQFKKLQLRHWTPDTPLIDSDDPDSNIFNSIISPRKPLTTYRSPKKVSIDETVPSAFSPVSSDKENDDSKVFYPNLDTSKHHSTVERPVTRPPASPSKSKLVSPSKKKARIPTPPHRPSIDAFWNVHAVNDWNDQHSPQKPLVSPKKNMQHRHDESSDSLLSSPRKNQSPFKLSRVEIEAKKDFESRKHQLCIDFLAELDLQVTDGKIKELAASTGGVTFQWSKTLNTTAGRAKWRRETIKSTKPDGTVDVEYKHNACIELAEKVIDDENRLLNVVAHEFCHLANYMVSGTKGEPHGHQFKAWGAKCTKIFAYRGIKVTTKHSYQIDYKYIWQCTGELCAQQYKRHSKSIDLAKSVCGVCRAKLVQVKPVPRKQGAESGPVGYAAFVKNNFADVKKSMVGASHKEVMMALGQRYRDQKAAAQEKAGEDAGGEGSQAAQAAAIGVEDATRAMEVVILD